MNNFDLKKYLIENKITTNSQMINEVDNTALMEIAKAVAKYYRDTDIDIQDVTNDDLAEDLEKYIINDVDNKDNQALKTAYEQLMSQPFKEAKKNIDKIWNLAEEMYSNETEDELDEGKYKAKLKEENVMGKIRKSSTSPGTKTSSKPERELSDFWKKNDLLNKNFEFIDLSIPNIKIGDNVVSWNGSFGKLVKIKDNKYYYIQFDADYVGEPPTKFKKESFEESFLLNKN